MFRDEGRARPGLDQLLATIRDRKASALVVSVLSRLGRTLGAFTRVIETLNEAGAPRVTIPTAPVLGIMLAGAQFDHEQLRGKRA